MFNSSELKKEVNICIAYELNLWTYSPATKLTLGNSLFGAVKLTTNADPDKYRYYGYDIGFDTRGSFSLSDTGGSGKNVIIFGVDLSSSAHVDNKKKGISILGKGPTHGLDNTTLTAGEQYTINFTEQHKKFYLSLHYNGVNSYLFVNEVEIYKFKAKDSEINPYPVCLGNISKDFSTNNMEKTGLLANIVNASNHTKCVSLSNQKCQIQSILINLHPHEHNQGFHYYPFAVKLEDVLEVVICV